MARGIVKLIQCLLSKHEDLKSVPSLESRWKKCWGTVVFVSVCVCIHDLGGGTQGFVHDKQVLCHWATLPCPQLLTHILNQHAVPLRITNSYLQNRPILWTSDPHRVFLAEPPPHSPTELWLPLNQISFKFAFDFPTLEGNAVFFQVPKLNFLIRPSAMT